MSGRAPWPQPAAAASSIHPSIHPRKPENERTNEAARIHGRSGGEAGARAAAVQPEHRGAHRGGLHPVSRAGVRRRAGGAGDHVPEGARHDVPQGRVGGGRVHGRGRPPRGPRGGRRPRRHRAGPRLLALPEPPLRGPDLRGLHVPAPCRRRAPPVARDGVTQAHLGNGAAGDGRVPALVDARGAGAARRAARRAAVRSLITIDHRGGEELARSLAAAPARKDRQREPPRQVACAHATALSISVQRQAGRHVPGLGFGRPHRRVHGAPRGLAFWRCFLDPLAHRRPESSLANKSNYFSSGQMIGRNVNKKQNLIHRGRKEGRKRTAAQKQFTVLSSNCKRNVN